MVILLVKDHTWKTLTRCTLMYAIKKKRAGGRESRVEESAIYQRPAMDASLM